MSNYIACIIYNWFWTLDARADQNSQVQGWRDSSVVKNWALAEDLGSISRTPMVPHNHLQLQCQGVRCPLLVSQGTNEQTQVKQPCIFFFKKSPSSSFPLALHFGLLASGQYERQTPFLYLSVNSNKIFSKVSAIVLASLCQVKSPRGPLCICNP